jgi:hypothetical protein
MQDTSLDDWIPTGEGIVTSTNLTEANEGIESIDSDYERNRRAARRLAEQYFAADQVVPNYLETAASKFPLTLPGNRRSADKVEVDLASSERISVKADHRSGFGRSVGALASPKAPPHRPSRTDP